MTIDKFLVIAGVPGVHKLISTRSNGLLIEDRKEGRTRFIAARQNQITPLGTVSMYVDTDEGTVPLADVFQKMLDAQATTPVVPVDSTNAELRAYFSTVLPEHDHDRVHITDIKKCLKWFLFMQEKGIFDEVKAAEEAAEPTPAEQATETDKTENAPETP